MTPEISRNYMFYLFIRNPLNNTVLWYSEWVMDRAGPVSRERIFKFLHGLNSEYNPIRFQILGKEKLPSLFETKRSIMLDKGGYNTGFAMVMGKGFTKRSTSKGKSFVKSSCEEYYMYCKRLGHTKNTCYKFYGKEKVLERMGGNKDPTHKWVNQTTSGKENIVEHPSTSQLDQDIQAFSKEEMDRLQALINSTRKPLGSCGLTMKGKSFFNISSSVPQSIWILDYGATDHMTSFPSYFTSYLKKLITIANEDHVPIVGFVNAQLQSSLSLHNVLHVTTPIRKICLPFNRQSQKLGQLLKFSFTINVLDIHRLGYLRECFHIYLQKSIKSFKCDFYQFSKHHHATFSPSNNKSLEPF
ncbi:hypothetical protein CR513_19243, partial [Mucuna pruriens]